MKRGQLTEKINRIAKNHIGREITQGELRLIPYIQYTLINSQRISSEHINGDERRILSKWRKEGFIDGGAFLMSVSKKFWDFMGEVLYEGYVIYEDNH